MFEDAVFRALGESVRREMLLWIAGQAHGPSLSEVSRRFGMSRQGATKHLRILKEAGLIAEQQHGRERRCRVETGPLLSVREWLSGLERPPARPDPDVSPVRARSDTIVDEDFPL